MKLPIRLLALLFPLFMACAQAAPVKITEVEGVSEYRLANGLKVLLAPDPSKPTITVNVTYLVGSRHENYGETGMAHLLEHLLFKGTPTHPNIPQDLSSRGMRPNGVTTYDRTQYFETFAAREDYLAWALGMEADRMVNSFIAEKDLRSEMTVVRNEMERGENSPGSVLRDKMLSAAYQWHSYGRSVIGARSDVENVRIGNLQAFYRTYYQPDNAVLTVAGKLDPARTLALVEQKFGAIAKPARALPVLYTVEPPQEGERSVRLERLGENRILDVIYHVPSGAHPDAVALDVFMEIMADTPSGRLHKALVESGKATGIRAWNADLVDPGYVFYSVQLRKEDAPEAARRVLFETLEGVASRPVTDDEVETARRAMLAGYDNTLNDSGRLAMSLSGAIGLGDWRLFFWQRDRLATLDAAEVNRVAQRYYRAANRTVGEFAPVDAPVRVEIPAAPDLAKVLEGYAGNAAVAAGEAFEPSPANIEARTQKLALENGLQLALLPKKTRGQTVRATMIINYGNAESLRGQADAAAFTSMMLMRGTQQRSRESITRELDRLRSQIHVGGSGQTVTVSVESVRENLPATLRLLREILREPAFDSNEFAQLIKQARAGVEAARVEPDSISDQALTRHFNDWPKDDIRYAQTFDEQLQSLSTLRLEDLQRFHARFYGADHAQFAAVGDFDAAELTAQVRELFGDWRSAATYQRLAHPFKPVAPVSETLETPDKQNAVFRAALRIPVGNSHPDYPALLVASRILGGGFISSRLANRLRQQEGISYSTHIGFSASREEQTGSFSAYAIYAPQFRPKVERAFGEELARAVRDGFSAEEVRDAQNAILQSEEMNRAQDGNLAWMLAADLHYGQDFGRVAAQEELIRKLTPAVVHAVLKKHIDPAAFSLFFAGNFANTVKQ